MTAIIARHQGAAVALVCLLIGTVDWIADAVARLV